MTWHFLATAVPKWPLAAGVWPNVATLVAVLTPMVVLPLGVITFHLRSLREHHTAWRSELVRRLERTETALHGLAERVADHDRQFTTKEDWIRENMLARRNIEQMKVALTRLETGLETKSNHRLIDDVTVQERC